MLKLPRPTQNAAEVYELCISRVRDADLKARLGSITNVVDASCFQYQVAAATQRLHSIAPTNGVGPVSTDELVDVYDQRMVGKTSPGRPVYDALIAQTTRCPLCAQRDVSTLDHHLPKVAFPVFAVAPINLIPACMACNKAKLDYAATSPEEVTLHPYFDDVTTERWLYAEVIVGTPSTLRFLARPPTHWNSVLQERVKNHFRLLGLSALFGSEAAEELLSIRHQLIRLHAAGGLAAVRSDLADRATSAASARLNSWRAAAYRAWSESDWFCDGGFSNA